MKVRDLFRDAAEETRERAGIGVAVTVDKPLVMRFSYPDGVSFSTWGTHVPLNSRVTAALLKDKRLTVAELHRMGVATPRTHFIDPDADGANIFRIRDSVESFIGEVGGYPVFVKPNAGSQGRDVFRVDGSKELEQILTRVVEKRRSRFIVQEACVGEEYRVIAIGGNIELAIRKRPLSIIGDGQHTIKQLLAEKFAELSAQGRHIKIRPSSPKVEAHLARQGFSLADKIENGREIVVIANKNLSDGASPVVCTDEIRADYTPVCARIHDGMGVEYAGYDFIADTRHGGRPAPKVLEINGSPGFEHFVNTGENHAELVKRIFRHAFEHAHQIHLAQRQARPPKTPSGELNAA